MSEDFNFAELERQVSTNPTKEQARRMGSTHYAYGWSPVPYGNWSDEMRQEYYNGYADAKARDSVARSNTLTRHTW